MRKLKISILQMKPTDVLLPPQKKRLRKQTEESSDPLPHSLETEKKAQHSDFLNWRERFKEIKKRRKTEVKRTKIPKTTIEEEVDEEQWKTHTLNPAGTHETAIVSLVEDNDEQENPEDIWIKAKTNLAIDLAIKESAKRKEQTLEEMIPQELMKYRSVFDKVAANRFPDR